SFERACALDAEGHPMELLLKPYGANAAYVMLGGNWSREMAEKSDEAAVAYALDALAKIYGPELRSAVRRGVRTHWSKDPDFEGTWAVTRPDADPEARKRYAEPVDDTIFISGEACAGRWAGTVNGAFTHGTEVGENIDDALRSRRRASRFARA